MSSQASLEANIWKYGLYLVTNKRIFAAILGAFYLTIPEVTPKILGYIMLAGSLSGFIFEIPSGYISDKIGHKEALILSRVLTLISTLLFLFANSITFLIVAGIFMSAGHAFLSGTGSAFMHETLRSLGRDKEYTNIMGKVSSYGFAIPVILTALVPFFVAISYKLPFVIGLILDSIGLIVACSLTKPKAEIRVEQNEVNTKNIVTVLKESYTLRLLPIALVSGVVTGMLAVVGGFRAPFQTVLSVPVIWFGVFHSIGRLLSSLMLAHSSTIQKWFPLRRFYIAQTILLGLLVGSLYFVEWNVYIVGVFILLNAFQWGLTQVDTGYQLSLIGDHSHKATLLSISSQFDHITAIIFGVGIGYVVEYTSYETGFLVMSIIFFAVLTPFLRYIGKSYQVQN